MNKFLKFGAAAIFVVSSYAVPVNAASSSQNPNLGNTTLKIRSSVKITSVSSVDFGNWTTKKLGNTIYNFDAIRLRIQDNRGNDAGDWTVSVKSDKVGGNNGQVCELTDYKLDGANATIMRQINDGKYQNFDDAIIKTGEYAAKRDNREWTPVISVRGTNNTKANYEVVWKPGTVGITLCNKLRPAKYKIVTHWMVTDGIS